MRTIKNSLLSVLAIFLLISSCKRESEFTKSAVISSSDGSKAKAWLESQSQNKGIGDSPDWSKTKYLSRSSLFLTPVKISGYEKINSGRTVTKIFVTSENSTGEINAGGYIYIIEKKNGINVKENNFERLNNIAANSFQKQKITNDFDGIILRYDLNYKLIESANFSNGENSNDLVSLVTKEDGGKSLEVSSFAEPPCGLCIDWYIQVIDLETGQVLSETYLFTQCGERGCEDGGGGDGGGIPPSVEAGLEDFANSAYATSIKMGVVEVPVNAETKLRYYNWKCLQGVGWSVRSSEKGTIKKVPNSTPGDWRLESVVHETHGVEGFYTLVSINPEIQNYNAVVGIYNFSTSFTLKVTYNMFIRGFPITRVRYYPCQVYYNISEGIE